MALSKLNMFTAVEKASPTEALEARRRALAPFSAGSEPSHPSPAPILGVNAMGLLEAVRARRPECDAACAHKARRGLRDGDHGARFLRRLEPWSAEAYEGAADRAVASFDGLLAAAGPLPELVEDVLRETSGVPALLEAVRRLLAPAVVEGRRARSAAARRAVLEAHCRLYAERLSASDPRPARAKGGESDDSERLRLRVEGLRAEVNLARRLALSWYEYVDTEARAALARRTKAFALALGPAAAAVLRGVSFQGGDFRTRFFGWWVSLRVFARFDQRLIELYSAKAVALLDDFGAEMQAAWRDEFAPWAAKLRGESVVDLRRVLARDDALREATEPAAFVVGGSWQHTYETWAKWADLTRPDGRSGAHDRLEQRAHADLKATRSVQYVARAREVGEELAPLALGALERASATLRAHARLLEASLEIAERRAVGAEAEAEAAAQREAAARVLGLLPGRSG